MINILDNCFFFTFFLFLTIFQYQYRHIIKMNKFDYLRYPPELYAQQPKFFQAIGTNLSGKQTRKLFLRVPYKPEQTQKIAKMRRYAQQHNKPLTISDYQILRYLYSTQFDQKQCLQKISIYLDWMHDPAIQSLSHKAVMILSQGTIYTFGRDKESRPVVYLDLSKIKLAKYEIIDYYCAFNALLNLVVENCFVHGVIQTYMFVIDMGGKNFTSLPFQAIGNIIKKMSIVYSTYLGTMLIINCQYFVKISYKAISIFIHEETRKKIQMLDSSEVQKIQQHIDMAQLHRKHGGTNPDPYDYWPPQIPGHKKVKISEEQSVYYSVQQNQSLFETYFVDQAQNSRASCCQGQCGGFESCSIF